MKKEKFISDKVPPHDSEIEKVVLGAMMLMKEGLIALDILKPEVFYHPEHQTIFNAIKYLYDKQEDVDILTVTHTLREFNQLEEIGGPYYISTLTNRVASSAHIEFHCRILQQFYMKRKAGELGIKAYEQSNNGIDVFKLFQNLTDEINNIDVTSLCSTRTIDFNSEKQPDDEVINFMGKRFLSIGNVSAIVAPPGSGKSNIIDAIAAAGINSNTDCLGFEVKSYGLGVYHADTERSYNDAINAYYRTASRVNISVNSELANNNKIRGYDFDLYKEIAHPSERKQKLLRHLLSKKYKLFLIDGFTDFMNNPNDLEESQALVGWLGAIASKHQVAILCTIHDNPKSQLKGSPRGHAGSELNRKVEGLLYIRTDSENREIKCITNDFEYGKLRNAGGKVERFIKWDTENKHMFISVDYKPIKRDEKKKLDAQQMFDEIFKKGKWLSKVELVTAIKKIKDCSTPTCYRKIDDALGYEWIHQDERGNYNTNKDATPF